MTLRELVVAQNHLVDRRDTNFLGREAATSDLPFGNDAGILGPACGGALFAKQNVVAAAEAIRQCDDGLSRLLVQAVGRNAASA
jgi:hypothetical protein